MPKSLVDEIKLYLCFMYVVLLDEPQILCAVEVNIVITLLLLFACTNVWHGVDLVHHKNVTHGRLLRVVHNSKESVFLGLRVAVLHSTHFTKHTVAVIATASDSKDCCNIVRTWVLKDELTVAIKVCGGLTGTD